MTDGISTPEELGEELRRIAAHGAFTVEWAEYHLEPHALCDLHVSSSDFSWALRQLKAGQRVRRVGWNGKGMWIVLIRAGNATHTSPAGALPMHDCIGMRTAQGTMQPGWLASQADMLVEDWELVE